MELTLQEGRIFGSRYYTIAPIFNFGEGHDWYNQHWNDMLVWCVETYGSTPQDGVWTPGARWYANNAKFWFRDKKDLEWFLLKWT